MMSAYDEIAAKSDKNVGEYFALQIIGSEIEGDSLVEGADIGTFSIAGGIATTDPEWLTYDEDAGNVTIGSNGIYTFGAYAFVPVHATATFGLWWYRGDWGEAVPNANSHFVPWSAYRQVDSTQASDFSLGSPHTKISSLNFTGYIAEDTEMTPTFALKNLTGETPDTITPTMAIFFIERVL